MDNGRMAMPATKRLRDFARNALTKLLYSSRVTFFCSLAVASVTFSATASDNAQIIISNEVVSLTKLNGEVDNISPKFDAVFEFQIISNQNTITNLTIGYVIERFYFTAPGIGLQGTRKYMPNDDTIIQFQSKIFYDDVQKAIKEAIRVASNDIKEILFEYKVCGKVQHQNTKGHKSINLITYKVSSESSYLEFSEDESSYESCINKANIHSAGLFDYNVMSTEIVSGFNPNKKYNFKRN